MKRLAIVLCASLAGIGIVLAADVTTGYNQGTSGFYSPIDRSGPYAIDSVGNAYLLGTSAEQGSSIAAVGIAPVITVSGTSLLGKAAPGNLYGASAYNTSAVPGFLVTTNLAAVPASGASISPMDCVPMAATGQALINYGAGPPDTYSVGIVVLASTSCTTYTPSTLAAFIKARVR